MRVVVTIVASILFSVSHAQVNLVPNPSFELNTQCPDALNYNWLNWYVPNYGSPDYYHTCAPTSLGISVPFNMAGYQYPRTGEAYAGFAACSPLDILERKEYVAVELTDTLKAGQTYCVEFYVSLANMSMYSISNIGALLTDTAINEPTRNLHYIPSVENSNGIINDTLNWVLISERYVAHGGEKFITIGNFNNNSNTVYQLNSWGTVDGAYYYIDDVSLTECELEEPEPPKPETGIVVPNVFTPNGDGVNDLFIIENLPPGYAFHLYNRWGELIYTSAPHSHSEHTGIIWNGCAANGKPLSEGVYYYVLTLPGKEPVKGVVHLVR